MIITYVSTSKTPFMPHQNMKKAVQFVLTILPPEYKEDFWASPSGEDIERSLRSMNIMVMLYKSEWEAIRDIANFDTEDMPSALYELGFAIRLGLHKGY